MSYRLTLTEPLDDELRRVAREQLDDAIGHLRDPGEDRTKAVHEARKDIKKLRALLRLAGPGLPGSVRRRENAALRDAGRLLSATRDADVLLATAADLRERYAGRLPADDFALDEMLRAGADGNGRGPASPGQTTAAAAGALEAIAARVDTWPLRRLDARAVRTGAATAYRRGARAGRAAARAADGHDAAWHDWRKRIKDLWYHERLLRELWPEVQKAHAAEVKRLSELLGDEHDLAVLAEALGDDPIAVGPLIAERRAELRDAARTLGRRVYAERPADAERRLRRWWRAVRDDAPVMAS